MSFWIKADVRLPRHRKTYLLANLLGQGDGQLLPDGRTSIDWRGRAIALLVAFWGYVAEHHPSGDITSADPEAIRDAVREWLEPSAWTREDVRVLLTKSGHLKRTRNGRLYVHGWREWTGSDLIRLAKERKRKQLARSKAPRAAKDRARTVRGQGAGQRAAVPPLEETRLDERTTDSPHHPAGTEAWQLLRGNLLGPGRGALEGYARSARHPDMLSLAIVAEGPDGIHAKPGVTYDVLGQALAEMQACGKEFSPQILRAFIRKLLERPPAPATGNGGETTPAERMRAAAARLEGERAS